MANKTLKNVRIVQKHDVEANWSLATNFIPMNGEFIIYDEDENYSYKRIKLGNGVDNVNDLPFSVVQPDWLQSDETSVACILNKPFGEEILITDVLPETTITDGTSIGDIYSYGYGYGYALEDFVVGETYFVEWDGITYETVAQECEYISMSSYNGYTYVVVGNAALFKAKIIASGDEMNTEVVDTGEPFVIYMNSASKGSVKIYTEEQNDHTFRVYSQDNTIKTLDEKFIPDTIARVGEISWNDLQDKPFGEIQSEPILTLEGNTPSAGVHTITCNVDSPTDILKNRGEYIIVSTLDDNVVVGTYLYQYYSNYEVEELTGVSGDLIEYIPKIDLWNMTYENPYTYSPIILDVYNEGDYGTKTIDEKYIPDTIQRVTDESLTTTDKTIPGAINELNTSVTSLTDGSIIVAEATKATRDADGNVITETYQTITDETLETTDKTVIGAINEVNTIANTQSDWSQNDSTAVDYIKNRTHYEESAVLIPEQEVTLSSGVPYDQYITVDNFISFEEGKTYIFIYGEETVECVCTTVYTGYNTGEILVEGLSGLGIQFTSSVTGGTVSVLENNSKYYITDTVSAGTYTISLIEEPTVKTLDQKFIPDTIQRITDDTLETTDKTVVGAINEVNEKASTQSDWNQSDETAVDYVKNRPMYDEPIAPFIPIGSKTSTEPCTTANVPVLLQDLTDVSVGFITPEVLLDTFAEKNTNYTQYNFIGTCGQILSITGQYLEQSMPLSSSWANIDETNFEFTRGTTYKITFIFDISLLSEENLVLYPTKGIYLTALRDLPYTYICGGIAIAYTLPDRLINSGIARKSWVQNNYQLITDESLETTDKTIIGAINELNDRAPIVIKFTDNEDGTISADKTYEEIVAHKGTNVKIMGMYKEVQNDLCGYNPYNGVEAINFEFKKDISGEGNLFTRLLYLCADNTVKTSSNIVEFQTANDNSLATTNKRIVGAINEINILASTQSDYAENDSTASSYIQNRTHYDSRETVELVNTSAEFTYDETNAYSSATVYTLTETGTITVTIDGTAYETEVKSLDDGTLYAGNPAIYINTALSLELEDTGEPFSIYNGIMYINTDTATTTHAIVITKEQGELVLLDDKYLIQSDWSVNDDTSAAYVKNKPIELLPFYKVEKNTGYVNVLELKQYYVTYYPSQNVTGIKLCAIADDGSEALIATLTGTTIPKITVCMIIANTIHLYVEFIHTTWQYKINCSNKATSSDITWTKNVILVPSNNTTEYTPTGDYNPATKKYVDDSILAIPQSDWNQNDETQADYIKNRTHYVGVEKDIIAEDCAVTTTGAAKGGVNATLDGVTLELGEIYIVTWDGVDYECIAQPSYTHVFLGNLSQTGGYYLELDENRNSYTSINNDEPFCIVQLASGAGFDVSAESGEHTFSIAKPIEVIHTLDEKYIPDSIARVEDIPVYEYKEYLENEGLEYTVEFSKGAGSATYDNIPLVLGQYWQVYVRYGTGDYELYTSPTDIYEVLEDETVGLYFGDLTLYAPMFYFTESEVTLNDSWTYRSNVTGLKIIGYPVSTTIKQLDEKFIPDTIQRVSDETLTTSDKTVSGAINELNAKVQFMPNELVLKDDINGYEYILRMQNGQLVSFCACSSIEVTTQPTKTEYTSGETFDPTGMVVTATCADGSTREITNYTYTTDAITAATDITISYIERDTTYTATVSVTVAATE